MVTNIQQSLSKKENYKTVCRRELNKIVRKTEYFIFSQNNQQYLDKSWLYNLKRKIKAYVIIYFSKQLNCAAGRLNFKYINNRQCKEIIRLINNTDLKEIFSYVSNKINEQELSA